MKNSVTVILILVIACVKQVMAADLADPESSYRDTMIFAIRHAEKIDKGKDPELSKKGKERAQMLVQLLQDAQITHLHSTPYKRTKETLTPLSADKNIPIALYNPSNLENLIEKMRHAGGRHVVAGHSNTTPKLIELLTGINEKPIKEKTEYDRLYIVTVNELGDAHALLLRFGNE